jgi:NAD+ kinase
MSPTVALVVNSERAEAVQLASELSAWLADEGAIVVGEDSSGDEFTGASSDLVVAIGGDGTVLRAVRDLAGLPVPVLGVNVGMLGYLTHVQPGEAKSVLRAWLHGEPNRDWWLDQRALLEVSVDRRRESASEADPEVLLCLNEAVLDRHESGRTVRIRLEIDGQSFAKYSADGVIVATPTGSTAYSLSARGPVLSPRVQAILVTPVSPHMLFDRSLVLSWNEEVSMVVDAARPARLSLDGIGYGLLDEGDTVHVRGSALTARFLRTDHTAFHRVLRDKFGLGGD